MSDREPVACESCGCDSTAEQENATLRAERDRTREHAAAGLVWREGCDAYPQAAEQAYSFCRRPKLPVLEAAESRLAQEERNSFAWRITAKAESAAVEAAEERLGRVTEAARQLCAWVRHTVPEWTPEVDKYLTETEALASLTEKPPAEPKSVCGFASPVQAAFCSREADHSGEHGDWKPWTERRAAQEDAQLYHCHDCGRLRTKAQGGTTFTVCDDCWDKNHAEKPPQPEPEICARHGGPRLPEVAVCEATFDHCHCEAK